MADIEKIREGTVSDAEKKLASLSDAELKQLQEDEKGDKARTTLLEAIEAEQDKRGDTVEETVSAAHKRGREAFRHGIPRDSSPYLDKERDDWQAGWDFQKDS